MIPRTDRRSRREVGIPKADGIKADRIGRTTKAAGFAAAIALWITFATAASAQPAESGERDSLKGAIPPAAGPVEEMPRRDNTAQADLSSICQMIESAASKNGLPVEFFARVIWQESRFKPGAVGPRTRSGQHAQGIAQFMPMTASERLLRDPFDPVQALPKSAEFLRDLRAQFGNLGLAAAAYNAGPQRVRDWLARKRTLPLETQSYVRKVTGHAAEEWARPEQKFAAIMPQGVPCLETATVVAKAQPPSKPAPSGQATAPPIPPPPWGVQLIGDRSEIRALAIYQQLQKKHQAILGSYQPVVVRTTLRGAAVPIWTRVRVDASTREVAQYLCAKLRTAGESCLVQRN